MKELAPRQAFLIPSLPSPSAGLAGVTVRLATDNKPYWCTGTTWEKLSTTVGMIVNALSGNTTIPNTPASTQQVYLCTSPLTTILPAASGFTSTAITLTNASSGNVAVTCPTGSTLQGTSSFTLYPNESVTLVTDGTNWFII